MKQRFNWLLLQEGALPLRPDGSNDLKAEHVCSSVLIWPTGEEPGPDNTVVTDPCFTPRTWEPGRKNAISLENLFACFAVGRITRAGLSVIFRSRARR